MKGDKKDMGKIKKRLASIANIKLIVIAVAVIAASIAVFKVFSIANQTSITIESDNKIDITPELIELIKAIGEWEFLSVSDEEMIDTVRRGIFSDDHLVRIYYGTMRLGVNMHHVKPGWIKASGDSVTMILPAISLLDNDFIDEARTRSFFESGRWTEADREDMYMRAHRKMLEQGMTKSNINSARNNADAQMRNMLKSVGFKYITIRFDDKP